LVPEAGIEPATKGL